MNRLQQAAGDLTGDDVEGLQATIARIAAMLPASANPLETMVLRNVLFDFASKAGRVVHARAHPSNAPGSCSFNSGDALAEFATARDPRFALERWSAAFVAGFRAAHPTSLARRAARILDREFSGRCTTAVLPKRLRVSPSTLYRHFVREYRMSLAAYRRQLRVQAALNRLGADKTEVVAHAVGYRSKKSLYAALVRVRATGPSGH